MNKKVSITILVALFLLIGFIVLSDWGTPESKLNKTKVNESAKNDFGYILGTSWTNNKDDISSSEISFYVEGLKDTKGFFEDFDILFKVSDDEPENAKLKVSINVNSINTDNDIRERMYQENQDQLEQDMAPFGFVIDGLEDENIGSAVDEYGTRWTPIVRTYDSNW